MKRFMVMCAILVMACVSAEADSLGGVYSQRSSGSYGSYASRSVTVSHSVTATSASSGTYGSLRTKRMSNRLHRTAAKLAASASHGG